MYIATFKNGKQYTTQFTLISFSSQNELEKKFKKLADTMLSGGDYDSVALYSDNPSENHSAIAMFQSFWKNDLQKVSA